MKIRNDFVTNSSSSSFIICFARISDMAKAQDVINKYGLKIYDAAGVIQRKSWYGELGASWCGAVVYGVDDILERYPNDSFIIITDRNDADYDEDWEPIYDYDFGMNAAIEEVTAKNGFSDIQVAEGEGRDG